MRIVRKSADHLQSCSGPFPSQFVASVHEHSIYGRLPVISIPLQRTSVRCNVGGRVAAGNPFRGLLATICASLTVSQRVQDPTSPSEWTRKACLQWGSHSQTTCFDQKLASLASTSMNPKASATSCWFLKGRKVGRCSVARQQLGLGFSLNGYTIPMELIKSFQKNNGLVLKWPVRFQQMAVVKKLRDLCLCLRPDLGSPPSYCGWARTTVQKAWFLTQFPTTTVANVLAFTVSTMVSLRWCESYPVGGCLPWCVFEKGPQHCWTSPRFPVSHAKGSSTKYPVFCGWLRSPLLSHRFQKTSFVLFLFNRFHTKKGSAGYPQIVSPLPGQPPVRRPRLHRCTQVPELR